MPLTEIKVFRAEVTPRRRCGDYSSVNGGTRRSPRSENSGTITA